MKKTIYKMGLVAVLLQSDQGLAMEEQPNGLHSVISRTNWQYIREDYSNPLYLPHNVILNNETLRGRSVVYIIPNITEIMKSDDKKIYQTNYDFKICSDLTTSYDIEFEIHQNSPLKLKFWDPSVIFKGDYRINRFEHEKNGLYSYHKFLNLKNISYSSSDKTSGDSLNLEWELNYQLKEFTFKSQHDCPVFLFFTNDFSISPGLEPKVEEPVQNVKKKKKSFFSLGR